MVFNVHVYPYEFTIRLLSPIYYKLNCILFFELLSRMINFSLCDRVCCWFSQWNVMCFWRHPDALLKTKSLYRNWKCALIFESSLKFQTGMYLKMYRPNLLCKVVKLIVSDPSNIFLWHESEDLQKSYFQNFSWFQLMFASYSWLYALALLHVLD